MSKELQKWRIITRITAEQQSVMDAIQATISMLSEAPLTAVRI